MNIWGFFSGDNEESAESGETERAPSSLWAVERKVDRILAALGVEADENDTEDGFERRISDLIAGGNKIGAIKMYREETGVGLKEAKDAIDAYAINGYGGAPVSSVASLERKLDRVLQKLGAAEAEEDEEDAPLLAGDVAEAIRAGNKIEAIRLYRMQEGVSLLEAKTAVDKMEREMR